MKNFVSYVTTCLDRCRENIGLPLSLYIIQVFLAYQTAGFTPDEAADLVQLSLQRAWPETKTEKE